MNNNDFANEKDLKDFKLNEEEINSVDRFADLTSEEKRDLAEFVFNLSLVLFKSYKNEQS